MKICKKCNLPRDKFRKRQSRSGKWYELGTCIYCERAMSLINSKKRYANFSPEQKKEHCKKSSKYNKTEKGKLSARKYKKDRELKDSTFLLYRRFSALFRNTLKYSKNNRKTFDCLDYTIQELKNNLESKFESWMNWNNWGVYNSSKWDDNDISTWTWNIDHIKPVKSFGNMEIGDENFKKCWSLDNLRPLSAKENILKGTKEI